MVQPWFNRGLDLLTLAQTGKQFLPSVALGFCQWNVVVSGATLTFDWPPSVPVRRPNSMLIHQIKAPRR